MDSMVRTTMAIEREIDNARAIRDTGVGDKRKEGQPSSSYRKKQKTSIPRGFQGQGRIYQGQDHIKAPSQSGLMTCFHCHQPRHMKRDFPQSQGSQGFGMAQSQSLVGHAQTQYVPFHPSVDQRNQYQP